MGDPVPRNCLYKWGGCPWCDRGGLCPPYFNITLDGLDDVWNVSLADREGNPVAFGRFQTKDGVVLSFRPDKEHYIDGQIGDYMLVFQMGPKGKPGVEYRIRSRVEKSEKPFRQEGEKRGKPPSP
jgi:hypothetical protein